MAAGNVNPNAFHVPPPSSIKMNSAIPLCMCRDLLAEENLAAEIQESCRALRWLPIEERPDASERIRILLRELKRMMERQ